MTKKLIIMQGVPGSGKSTIAKELVEKAKAEGLTASIRSTDDQFMINGKYCFDVTKLGQNHMRNQQLTEDDCKAGINLIIVDNTNIRADHARSYVKIGRQYGYEVEVCRVDPGLIVAKQRNATRTADRKIPEHIIDKMYKEMQQIVL